MSWLPSSTVFPQFWPNKHFHDAKSCWNSNTRTMLWTLLSLLCVKYIFVWFYQSFGFEGNITLNHAIMMFKECNQKPLLWPLVSLSKFSSGMMHAKRKYSLLWIISALVSSNWSQITFFILANLLTSISSRFSPNFDQINISATGSHFPRLHI